MDYQHYDSFIVTLPNGKKYSLADDFNGTIINTNDNYYQRECLPDFTDVTEDSPRDGKRFIDSKYNPRQITIDVMFKDFSDYDEIKRVLGKKFEYEFEYEDDWTYNRYLKVKFNKGFESKTYYNSNDEVYYGQATFEFIAYDPYWKMRNERLVDFKNLEIGNVNHITSKGNVDCYPIIHLYPTTNVVKMKWNDIDITMQNLIPGKEYVINCETEEFYRYDYENKTNVLLDYSTADGFYTFPYIDVDNVNSFYITEGSVAELKINANSRLI